MKPCLVKATRGPTQLRSSEVKDKLALAETMQRETSLSGRETSPVL